MSWLITPQQKNKGLLDEFTGAAAAYSLRDLSLLRNAPVIRVRRSSDSAEQDFTAAQIANGTLTTFCGAGDGFVCTWYDQTNNGRDATQLTQAAQPRVVISGVLQTSSSYPAIVFNGSSTSLRLPVAGFANISYFRVADTADNEYIVLAASNYSVYGWVSSIGSSSTTLSQSFGSPTMYANGSLQSLTTRGNVYTALNGRKLETTLSANLSNSNWTTQGTIVTDNFSGKLSEFIFYTSSVLATRAAIEANINAHYAIY